jgi:uncharacterized protein YjiS (DUF1127 family)
MISKLAYWYKRNQVYKQTLRDLRSLTPKELDDLGIEPGDIEELAREAAYGDRNVQ